MKRPAMFTILLTASASFTLLILTISGLAHIQAQSNSDSVFSIPGREPIDSGGGSLDLPTDELSDADRQAIQAEISSNVARLAADGVFSIDEATAVSLP